MLEQVKKILSEYTEEEIHTDSSLSADLELTSFDLLSIITDFEDTYHIEISDRDISQFIYVSDILEYLELHISEY